MELPDQYSKPIAEHIAGSGAYDVLDIGYPRSRMAESSLDVQEGRELRAVVNRDVLVTATWRNRLLEFRKRFAA